MIQTLGLLLAGAAAAGLMLADNVLLVLVFWALGAVLYAGLAALGRSAATARAARRGFIVEMVGAWALALGALNLVLTTGTGDLALLPSHLLLMDLGRSALPWAGLGVLLAVLCRLGVPPAPPWTAGVAAAPPSVRIFLHAGLHPLTALVLWHRLDVWLLPWHRELALWLGGLGALLLALAAAGERHGGRRAAYDQRPRGTGKGADSGAAFAAHRRASDCINRAESNARRDPRDPLPGNSLRGVG